MRYPKIIDELYGSKITVDYYGDNHRLAAIKLDRLDDYIETVLPGGGSKNEDSIKVRIDTGTFLPKT